MTFHYDVFVDETVPPGRVGFAFGAVSCSPERSERVRADIANLKTEAGMVSEIKWTKTTPLTLALHRRVVDVFFDHQYPRLMVLNVEKGLQWHAWGRTEEERFFKSLYFFLMRCTGPGCRYRVYLDDRDLQKSYRRRTLHYLINRSRRRSWGVHGRNIQILTAVDSHTNELVQLTDLLLGCATSPSKAKAKCTLRKHFNERRQQAYERVRIDAWTPQLPNLFAPVGQRRR